MTTMDALFRKFDAICDRIDRAVSRSGRSGVRLVAVSKLHGAEAVAALAAYWASRNASPAPVAPGGVCGASPVFGESYAQEAAGKMPEVAALLRAEGSTAAPDWHFIGHVQSRKARDVAGQFSLIHSVDSLKLGHALQHAWQTRVAEAPRALHATAPAPQDVLVQVNIGREPQKAGVAPEAAEELIAALAALPELRVQGLMCLPPYAEEAELARPYFQQMRRLREQVEKSLELVLPHLSMGMSGDFEAAIEEGATLVRIGTDIFGPRQQA